MQYNELLATIAIVKDTKLKERRKNAYSINECVKRVLNKVNSNFTINEQKLIYYKGLVYVLSKMRRLLV
jgi:hypothetical protein